MTYYTLPKLFKYIQYNIIQQIQLHLDLQNSNQQITLLENLLNTLNTDDSRKQYDEIKSKYSFTDLLNLKISDDIYHPKTYFAFIEISKICKIFNSSHLNTMHISDSYDYLDALYQLRDNHDNYIFLSENTICNTEPSYLTYENTKELDSLSHKYASKIDLISINYDDMKSTVKFFLLALLFQNTNGNMIIKIKRLNNHISKEIIYILMSLYNNVLIIKPKIVNSVNEYKYIVATQKMVSVDKYSQYIIRLFNILNKLSSNQNIHHILKIDIPQILVNKIDECELIMSENTLNTHMKILNSIHVNNINLKSLEKKNESETNNWLRENFIETRSSEIHPVSEPVYPIQG